MCTHDQAMSSCQIHRDCLNYNELVCVNGANGKTPNLRCFKIKKLKQSNCFKRPWKPSVKIHVAHHGGLLISGKHWSTARNCLPFLSNRKSLRETVVKLTDIQRASHLEQAEAQQEGEQSAFTSWTAVGKVSSPGTPRLQL
ncbi:protein of unknown function [Methylocaldum szegediense]|jgi:hypothetical protein|uniref:Uncharacterized protein n=1 Tax=Methylocaldum szegediense TaxID=73780 RepID=A0ABN8X877_9GAMM|nr:protein of unknown function [Methylocaldum szegediense]